MGKQLEIEFASLPGHVRVMIPEIRAIAKNEREFVLLTELAKSANSRNLIGSLIKAEDDVEPLCRRMAVSTSDAALRVRVTQALVRFDKEMRGRARHLA